MGYDEQLDREFQKQCDENEKFCEWLDGVEEQLMEEFAERNPDFDPMDNVWYSRFLNYANDVYDRRLL